MAIPSAGLQQKFALWRAEMDAGTMTQEKYREVILALRADRSAAASASAASAKRTKAKAAIPSADDMLGELGA